MTMVWDLANGAGIPAPSDATDVCFSKHQSALIGGDGDSSSTEELQDSHYVCHAVLEGILGQSLGSILSYLCFILS